MRTSKSASAGLKACTTPVFATFGLLSISPLFVRRINRPGIQRSTYGIRASRTKALATKKERTMRFMVLVKAIKNSEAGVLPDEQLIVEMGKFNEQLVKAGVMLAGDGLQPSSKGARIKIGADGKRTVIDGPVHRNQRAARRLLDDSGEVEGGSDRVVPALPGRGRDSAGVRRRRLRACDQDATKAAPSWTPKPSSGSAPTRRSVTLHDASD